MSVGPHPFSAMIEIILNKKGGSLGIVQDYVVITEYQKRGGIHWHILFWVEPGSASSNVVMAEIPRYSDTSSIEAKYARRMVQKYEMHCECYPSRCFEGYGGKVLSKCKYGFPFLKFHNLWMKLMRIVYALFTDVGVRRIVWLYHTI